MPKRALVERRPWLLGSLIAAIAYYLMRDGAFGGIYLIGIKGAAVGLLAVYAALRHAGRDASILATVMVLAACGDMVIELDRIWAGTLFFASHLVAMVLYLRNRRENPTGSQKAAAVALLLLTPLIAFGFVPAIEIALYALTLGAMAATAWTSRFPRYRVGAGAIMIVASDLLLFADMGPLAGSPMPELLVWPLYYAGQILICTGVIQTLRRDHQA